jgi:asparagine N-glycosylation enzyme membrane subunit Stt3
MEKTTLQKAGLISLAGTGAIHLALAPEYFSEQAYVGVLFVLGGIACLGLAAWIWRRANDAAAWTLAALASAGMALGFVLSRTVGLPGFHEGEWEASGLLTLLLEGTVVVAAANAVRAQLPGARVSTSG